MNSLLLRYYLFELLLILIFCKNPKHISYNFRVRITIYELLYEAHIINSKKLFIKYAKLVYYKFNDVQRKKVYSKLHFIFLTVIGWGIITKKQIQ